MKRAHDEQGFSLLEALIVAAMLAIVSGGVLKILYQGQEGFQSETQMNRATEQARIAMDVMVRYLRHAGNDPFGNMEAGGIPPVQILGSREMLVSSDLTGSVASTTGDPKEATGDPNGDLTSIHEQIRFRHDPTTQRLFMDIGYGENVLADGVVTVDFEYFDRADVETTDSSEVARVKIKMIARTGRARRGGGNDLLTLHSDVFLRSQSFDPFAADPESASSSQESS